MLTTTDIWKLIAGIAIFMLGMNFLEDGLKKLTGRRFKLFLKRQTSNNLKAITGGTIITGFLQSSSVVSLMVLAFVGAGIITVQNALAVILGANLGTTFSSWIIATVGFQINIESFSLPIAGISGIAMMLANKENKLFHWSKLLFGFSFLFLGLSYIKTGMENAVLNFDLGLLKEQPAIIYLLAGLLITSLIQSSSATVAIILSALNANIIGLFAATAMVLGSETGTTIKLILASIKGIAAKKRVALGTISFNLISTIIALIFLLPINNFIVETIGIKNDLIALVFFQTLLNLGGIILFYPFLKMFGKLLEMCFKKNEKETLFIHKVKYNEIELALSALEKETLHFIYHVAKFTLSAFNKSTEILNNLQLYKDFESKKIMEKYDYLKHLHGELYSYSIKLQNLISDKDLTIRVRQLISTSRNIMYAAKSLKDILPDIEQLKRSSNDTKFNYFHLTRNKLAEFYEEVITLLKLNDHTMHATELAKIYKNVQEGYREGLKDLYKESLVKSLNEIEFSTLVNFNREMYTSEKSIVFALKDFLLNEKESAYFEELPGFIR